MRASVSVRVYGWWGAGAAREGGVVKGGAAAGWLLLRRERRKSLSSRVESPFQLLLDNDDGEGRKRGRDGREGGREGELNKP